MRNFLSFLLCVALIGSQFYIFESGLPQPSYGVFAFFILFCFIFVREVIYFPKNYKIYIILYIFYPYVLASGLVWSFITEDIRYNLFSLYLLYDLLLFHCVVFFMVSHEKAIKAISFSLFLSLLLCLIIFIFGFGRNNYGFRYNGFFNDPNQMSLWVLCCYAAFTMLVDGRIVSKSVLFFISLGLIFSTASRSGLVGAAFVLFGTFLSFMESKKSDFLESKINKKIIGGAAASIFFVLIVVFSYSDDGFSKVMERLAATDFAEQASVRGYDRIVDFPQYLVLGAGYGGFDRFGSIHEIHSTWASMLFSYGIPGILLFSYLIFLIMKNVSWPNKFIMMGPLMYSFSTFGARTPIFWFFLACCLYSSIKPKG